MAGAKSFTEFLASASSAVTAVYITMEDATSTKTNRKRKHFKYGPSSPKKVPDTSHNTSTLTKDRIDLLNSCLESAVAVLGYATSPDYMYACIIVCTKILTAVCDFDDHIEERVSSDLRMNYNTIPAVIELVYSSIFLASRAIRLIDPRNCPLSVGTELLSRKRAHQWRGLKAAKSCEMR